MKRILLMALGLSVFLCADFTRDETGIVTDSTNGLQWDDATPVQGTDDMKWTDAIDYCENLNLDGTGWRLPNINELESLVDDSRVETAIVDVFVHTNSDPYWSSTSVHTGESYAQTVNFYSGTMKGFSKSTSHYVRCVRDIP